MRKRKIRKQGTIIGKKERIKGKPKKMPKRRQKVDRTNWMREAKLKVKMTRIQRMKMARMTINLHRASPKANQSNTAGPSRQDYEQTL